MEKTKQQLGISFFPLEWILKKRRMTLILKGSEFVSPAIDLAVREFIDVASPGRVNHVELVRAKESTRSGVLMNLESRMVVSEDMGRQILTYGERKLAAYFLEAIDGITLEDIATTAQKIISSPLTMASWGDVVNVPSYDTVSGYFRY